MMEFTPESLINRIIEKRINRNRDAVCTMSGEEGAGKSTLSFWLYWWFLKKRGIDFTWQYLGYHNYQVYPLLSRKTPAMVPVWIDENALYKREWFNAENKLSIEALMRCRFLKRLYLLNGPRLIDWDEYLRNHRIRYWIEILKPGLGFIYKKDRKIHSGDPWHLDDFRLMRKRCLFGKITYDDMPEWAKQYYDPLKEESYDTLDEKYEKIQQKIQDKENGNVKRGRPSGFMSLKQAGNGFIRLQTEVKNLGGEITDKHLADMFNIEYKQVCNAKLNATL